MKGAIFDLDGTLVDSVKSISFACNEALKKCGLAERSIEEYNYFAGNGANELVKKACYASGDTEYEKLEDVLKLYQKNLDENCTMEVVTFKYVEEMLENLKQKGIKLAVLSNKPHLNTIKVVETVFGKDYFDYILGYKDEETKKPNPYGALLIAKELNIPTNEFIYVGDTDTDMKTGKGANMFTVGVTWGFRERKELEDNNADKIIDSPLEIIDLF